MGQDDVNQRPKDWRRRPYLTFDHPHIERETLANATAAGAQDVEGSRQTGSNHNELAVAILLRRFCAWRRQMLLFPFKDQRQGSSRLNDYDLLTQNPW